MLLYESTFFLAVNVLFYLFILIEVKLIYNIVLVSGAQHSNSVIYIYTHTHTYIYIYIYTHTHTHIHTHITEPSSFRLVLYTMVQR